MIRDHSPDTCCTTSPESRSWSKQAKSYEQAQATPASVFQLAGALWLNCGAESPVGDGPRRSVAISRGHELRLTVLSWAALRRAWSGSQRSLLSLPPSRPLSY